jgi:hypothetical protein
MSANIYTMQEPLMQRIVTSDGSASADIDLVVANNVIADVQDKLNTTNPEEVAEHFRPWVAKKLNVGVESLTIGQVVDLQALIAEVGNQAIEESKKKRATTLSSLFSTPESPTTTEDGPQPPKTDGSATTQGVLSGNRE